MKTIKELEDEGILDDYFEGYKCCKEEVLEVIDELRKKRGDTIELMELKARINGEELKQ